MNLHLLSEHPMPSSNESTNPFELPRTVSAAKNDSDPVRMGWHLRDLRYQAIGFSALAFTGLLAVSVGAGVLWFLPGLDLHARWDWLITTVQIAGGVTVVVGLPTFFISGIWTFVSWVQFAIAWRTGRIHQGTKE